MVVDKCTYLHRDFSGFNMVALRHAEDGLRCISYKSDYQSTCSPIKENLDSDTHPLESLQVGLPISM